MANILRMDLYRLVHGKSLWIFLAVIAVLAVISAATMAYITDPAFVQSMQAASASGAPTGVHIGFSNGSGPSADDLAETNALVAQLAQGMTPEALVGKTLAAIINLPPRKMMGQESCGMLLSAVHKEKGEEKLNLLMLNDAIPAGAKLC